MFQLLLQSSMNAQHNYVKTRVSQLCYDKFSPFLGICWHVHVWCLAGSDWFQQICEEHAIITIFETALCRIYSGSNCCGKLTDRKFIKLFHFCLKILYGCVPFTDLVCWNKKKERKKEHWAWSEPVTFVWDWETWDFFFFKDCCWNETSSRTVFIARQ